MDDFLLRHETPLRLSAFLGVLAAVALAETLAPRRARRLSRWRRWPSNIGIVVLNSLLGRLALPMAPIAFAVLCAERGWGVFNLIDLPPAVAVIASVVLLDLFIYLQHVMVHAVPLLWRLHRVHHADTDYDVTTGARFHPLEILLSLGLKMSWIALLGAPPAAVLIFEVLLNATAMFNHANLRLPDNLDRKLRLLLVTPDMHRVHHSPHPHETNSNFGFSLAWWDRLFGTYRAQPADGHAAMTIGLGQFRDPAEQRLDRMLTQPWRGGADTYVLNRRDAA